MKVLNLLLMLSCAAHAADKKDEVKFPDKNAKYNMICQAGKASFLATTKDAAICTRIGGTLAPREPNVIAEKSALGEGSKSDKRSYPDAPQKSFGDHARRYDDSGNPQIQRNFDPSRPVGQ